VISEKEKSLYTIYYRKGKLMIIFSKPIQRKDAEKYIQLSVLGLAASVTLTRFILEATGYPQLGNETLHIAHCLYGGVILYVGCLIPLIFSNRWAFTWSGILSGAGMGLFIDEVGKFMTQNNDYFFPAAAPIIYGFFLLTVLVYIRVARTSDQLSESRDEAKLDVDKFPWATPSRLKTMLIAGFFLFGVGGCIRLIYYYSGGTVLLETLLYSRISDLPNVSSNSLYIVAAQLWLEGLVGALLVISSVFLVLGRERKGIIFGAIGLIISLVGVNLVNFYIDQFGTIAKALSQFILLYALNLYQIKT
jgi:hypothetical protein